MRRKGMPALSTTGRRYLDRTRGARLASPGLEKYVPARSRTPRMVVAAVLLVAALVGAMLWFSRGG
jgi:hypothetical protein